MVNNSKYTAIDLGTNTFHLVSFRLIDGKAKEVQRCRQHVFLSEEGIEKIGEASMKRAKSAIDTFKELISPLDDVRIIGTAAFRSASNGADLKQYVEHNLNSPVEIISGDREAELIATGVLWELGNISNGLIMDIGGGSVEFIHIVNNIIRWKKSFQIGVGVLAKAVVHSEPITQDEIEKLKLFIATHAMDVIEYTRVNPVNLLIGSSGSFELIPSILQGEYPPNIDKKNYLISEYIEVKNQIFQSSLEKRRKIKGMPPVRAELVVVAFVLMDWIIKLTGTENIQISRYSVKEGLIKTMLDS